MINDDLMLEAKLEEIMMEAMDNGNADTEPSDSPVRPPREED